MNIKELKKVVDIMEKYYYGREDFLEKNEIIEYLFKELGDKFSKVIENGKRHDNLLDLLYIQYIPLKNIIYVLKGNSGVNLRKNDIILDRSNIDNMQNKYMKIVRDGEVLKIEKPCISISSEFVTSKIYVMKNYVYYKLAIFDEFSISLIDKIEIGDKKIILDMRNNMGGRVGVANRFLKKFIDSKGVIYYLEDTKRKKFVVKFKEHAVKYKKNQLFIFVNEYTASSAELVASVLKEERGAIIFGRKTFGKGLIQKKYRVSKGKEIFIPIYRFYTDNYNINGIGIYPDYTISEKILDTWIGEKTDEAYAIIPEGNRADCL